MAFRSTTAITLFTLGLLAAVAISGQRRKKDTQPPDQVLPLPPEPPMALQADTQTLDFHISPLLKTGGLSVQIRQSLNDLIRDTHGETIVRLRSFVAGAGDARRVQAQVAALFTEHKLPLPVLSTLQVGGVGEDTAQVVIEAVVATHRNLNPNGLVFIGGQTGPSLAAAVQGVMAALRSASASPQQLLTCTCFTSRIDDYAATVGGIHSSFPNAAVNVVQSVREPFNDTSTCEGVGQLAQAPTEGSVVWIKKSHVTAVHTSALVFTGLQLTFGSFLDDAHQAFARLQRTASAFSSNQTPIQVNAFTLDRYAASALLKTTSFPLDTFTLEMIQGLPAVDATAGIEAVLAPNALSPVSR
jgi:enamine deaminase RidA (YjgF/YER057c/UK114 family)